MNQATLRAYLQKPMSRAEVVTEFCRDKVVLDLGCVCHDMENVTSGDWLHKIVKDAAREVLGVDYLEREVQLLREQGYDVVSGDVTKPLSIQGCFDVIVAGNLIEHLSNFEGFMQNIVRLLAPGGVVLISTPNPFFREQYFYSALKNDIIVNPEHTCWIDPVTLDQLARRFGLQTQEVRWIKEKWKLSEAIFHGSRQSLDIFTGRWTYGPQSPLDRLTSPWLERAYLLTSAKSQSRLKKKYPDDLGRYLYMRLKGLFVEGWWRVRRLAVPVSDINRYEMSISVLVSSSNPQPCA